MQHNGEQGFIGRAAKPARWPEVAPAERQAEGTDSQSGPGVGGLSSPAAELQAAVGATHQPRAVPGPEGCRGARCQGTTDARLWDPPFGAGGERAWVES